MKLNKSYKINDHKKKLNESDKKKIISLIKQENSDSIIASLSIAIISEYLDIAIKSKKLQLFTIKKKKEYIGYALIAEKPRYLISEFNSLKIKLFFNLLLNIKFFSIMNLIMATFGIDKIFLNKKDIFIINNNLNLNLLAIKKNYQSKGIGYYFLKNLLYQKKKNNISSYITCETFNIDAIRFYVKKLKFKILGRKLRFTKKMTVLSLKIK